jgi:hypothetical protein
MLRKLGDSSALKGICNECDATSDPVCRLYGDGCGIWIRAEYRDTPGHNGQIATVGIAGHVLVQRQEYH